MDVGKLPEMLFTKANTVMQQFEHKQCNLAYDDAVFQILQSLRKKYVVAYTKKINGLEGEGKDACSVFLALQKLIQRLSLLFEIKHNYCTKENLELVLYFDDGTKVCHWRQTPGHTTTECNGKK